MIATKDIFLLEDFTVKIGDFGLATVKTRWSASGPQKIGPTGSILWMAPEVIRMREGQNPYSLESDVYSYGIVLYEMTTSTLPYTKGGTSDRVSDVIIFQVGRGFLRPDLKLMRNDTPRKLRKLLTSCISVQADDRPRFPHICEALERVLQALPRISRSRSDPGQLSKMSMEQILKMNSTYGTGGANINASISFSPDPPQSVQEL